jgi:hypothetical protein
MTVRGVHDARLPSVPVMPPPLLSTSTPRLRAARRPTSSTEEEGRNAPLPQLPYDPTGGVGAGVGAGLVPLHDEDEYEVMPGEEDEEDQSRSRGSAVGASARVCDSARTSASTSAGSGLTMDDEDNYESIPGEKYIDQYHGAYANPQDAIAQAGAPIHVYAAAASGSPHGLPHRRPSAAPTTAPPPPPGGMRRPPPPSMAPPPPPPPRTSLLVDCAERRGERDVRFSRVFGRIGVARECASPAQPLLLLA